MKNASLFAHNWLVLRSHNGFFARIREEVSGCVVDLGCGTMPYREELVGSGCRYIGVDWSSSRHGRAPDIVSDLNRALDVPSEVADAVVSISVLEHLYQPHVMLAEAWRVLRPGGLLFLQVPFQWWVHEAPHDYYRFTRYGLEFLLTAAGFVDARIEPDGGFWTTVVLKWNYHSLRWVRGPRPVRWLARLVLTPFWAVGQSLAPLLDRVDPNPAETASYTVRARKPVVQRAAAEDDPAS
jgi:SAM-dependent methyltransferase